MTTKTIGNQFAIANPQTDLLGQGAMGTVYRGTDTHTQQTVAIKILKSDIITNNPDLVERFKREGEALRQLNHPNIVKMLAALQEGEQHYLIMEYVEGGSLRELLAEKKQLAIQQTLEIALDLADALTRAHRLNIIHRDIKPGNVLLAQDGTPRLGDFGVAHIGRDVLQSNQQIVNASMQQESSDLTQVGTILGTIAYLSPEVCLGEAISTKADIWAFGILLYEMLTGQRPFSGASTMTTMNNILAHPVPNLQQQRSEIPQALADLLYRILEKDPQKRIPSIRLIGAELEALLQQFTNKHSVNNQLKQTNINIHNYYYGLQTSPQSTDPTQINTLQPSPYRGLYHFGPDDANIFFGREYFTEQLLNLIDSHQVIAVLGASGSGKSSVVLAGLVPQLEKTGTWQFTHFRPGKDPFKSLATALAPLYFPQATHQQQVTHITQLSTTLYNNKKSLTNILTTIQQHNPHQNILLIADQFEELYTFCPDSATRHQFLDTLLDSIELSQNNTNLTTNNTATTSKTVFVFTMRADFLGHALNYRPLAKVLSKADVKLGPMNSDELREAIKTPAEVVGASFESGLVDRILNDVGDEPGNLPLLQFALSQLWEKKDNNTLSHATYQAIGKVEGALARHADDVYQNLNHYEQEEMRRIFIQLVRPGQNTEDTRRLATKTELGAKSWPLVKKLADARLIVTTRNEAEEDTAEIVHEALIHHWHQLQQWMTEERQFRIWQERIRVALKQWQESKQSIEDLLRGSLLVEAKERLLTHPTHLNELEKTFIQRSIAWQQQQEAEKSRRQQEQLAAIETQAKEQSKLNEALQQEMRRAEQKERQAYASRLAAQSYLVANEANNAAISLPLMLAREAVLSTLCIDGKVVPDADAALRQALHTAPPWQATLPPFRHTDNVWGTAISPDNTLIATAGGDQIIHLWHINTEKHVHTLQGHTNWVTGVDFSPDGKLLASASKDCTAKLWDVATGQQIATLSGHNQWVNKAVFNHDGTLIATCGDDNTIRLWSTTTWQEIKRFTGYQAQTIDFSPDGKLLAISSTNSLAYIKLVSTGEVVQQLTGHTAEVWDITFSPSGQQVVTGSSDGTACVWLVETGEMLLKLSTDKQGIYSVCFSPDGKMIATGYQNGFIQLWSSDTGAKITDPLKQPTNAWCIRFSLDGRLMASTGFDGGVSVWDIKTHKKIYCLPPQLGSVWALALHPNKHLIVTGSDDGIARLWNLDSKAVILQLKGHTGPIKTARFSPNGEWVITGGDDKIVKLWETATGNQRLTFQGHTDCVWDSDFSPDGEMIATVSDDSTIRLWETNTGKEVAYLETNNIVLKTVSFSPDGQELIVGGADNNVYIYTVATQQKRLTIKGHASSIWATTFSPDGQTIATASEDGTARVWHKQTGEEIARFKDHKAPVKSINFSPNGHYLVTGGDDNNAYVYNLADKQQILQLKGHTRPILTTCFSKDGQQVVTASVDQSIKLWSMKTNIKVKKLPKLAMDIKALSFSPDGRYLVAGDTHKTINVWYTDNFEKVYPIDKSIKNIRHFHFSLSGKLIVICEYDDDVRFFDLINNQQVFKKLHLNHTSHEIITADFSPNEKFIATTNRKRLTQLWRLEDGKEILHLQGSISGGRDVITIFSPDSTLLLTNAPNWSMQLWNISNGQKTNRLVGHQHTIHTAKFNPNGTLLATAGSDDVTIIWDVNTGDIVHTLNHNHAVKSVSFSPDGTLLATGYGNYTANVWSVETGEKITHLTHSNTVSSMAFSPDGQWLATAANNIIRLWPANFWQPVSKLLPQVEALIQREPPLFTPEEQERFKIKKGN